jgi:NADH dehydrogenase
MILVCGATGELGGRVVRLLRESGSEVRALVRPETDAAALEGVEVIRGDLRQPATLGPALSGVDTVVTTVTSIGRSMAGEKGLTIANVDTTGAQDLVRAAERAGVRRFVYVSAAGMGEAFARSAPLMAAKLSVEKLLGESPMQVVLVQPDMFQEVWLAPESGIRPAEGKALIYGKGTLAHRYVAIDDVAALCTHVTLAEDPPHVVEFGGPEALSRLQVVAAFEKAAGRKYKVRHVPVPVLAVGHRVLSRIKPDLASIMGMALFFDTHPGTWDDTPLRQAGIDPRPATEYIQKVAGVAAH